MFPIRSGWLLGSQTIDYLVQLNFNTHFLHNTISIWHLGRMCLTLPLHSLPQVVVILPTNRKDRYDAVKKLLCVEFAGLWPSLCMCICVHLVGEECCPALPTACPLGGQDVVRTVSRIHVDISITSLRCSNELHAISVEGGGGFFGIVL